jgi:tRNA threonylcarbamoyladenosine biosynthesis protein TsaE
MIVKSLEHLNSLSRKIADKLAKNDCIFLIGEIGVGKTTFTRYLINYLQEKRGEKITEVLSPTFNLLYEYDLKDIKIMHYDLYRIKEKKELKHLGIFLEKQDTIKIIEWPQLINIPLSDKLEIYIDYAKNEKIDEIIGEMIINNIKYNIINAELTSYSQSNSWLTIEIAEGKNREVRKIFEHLDIQINRLIRIKFGPFELGQINKGEFIELNKKEVPTKLKKIGFKE